MSARRKPPRDPEAERQIHEEMLRHLEGNPPPKPVRVQPKSAAPAPRTPIERPRLMLRRLRRDVALERLARFLELHARRKTPEVLVIVGQGHNTPGGEPVIGPAALEFCRRSDLVRDVQEAPARDGGRGALVVRLRS